MRNVALDLAGDRSARRALRPEEEFVLKRGRDHEDALVGPLMRDEGYVEPDYPERDFAAGEAATLDLMRAGVPGILQGVVCGTPDDGVPRLGIPDLLRRVDGGSDLGAFHYEVGDVKSSARMRGDQILQVVFYSRLLEAAQGRLPEHGYIVLKDGREERFRIRDHLAVLDGVEERLVAVHRDPGSVEAHLVRACGGCRWSPVCGPELEGRDDLSLVDGMTRGVARTLRDAGVERARGLASASTDEVVARTGLDAALVRRLQASALARTLGRVVPEKGGRVRPPRGEPVVLGALFDPFADRLLWAGAATVADGALIAQIRPARQDLEWREFLSLASQLPAGGPIWHAGPQMLRWIDECSYRASVAEAEADGEALPWDDLPHLDEERFLDVVHRARAAASWPRPVFGLDDLVELALGSDPHRAGRADEAAWRLDEDPAAGDPWLQARGRALCEDLAGLARWTVDRSTAVKTSVHRAAADRGRGGRTPTCRAPASSARLRGGGP